MANIATGPISLALEGYTGLYKNALLSIYSGAIPATAETALSSNVLLCSFQFSPSPPFQTVVSAGGFTYQLGNFVATSVAPSASGIAAFARATFALSSQHSGAWTTATTYSVGDIVTSNNSYWVCVGPSNVTGTSGATAPLGSNVNGFYDGGVTWNYINPVSTGPNLGDFTVGLTSSFDLQLGNTTISTGTNVVLTSMRFQTASS